MLLAFTDRYCWFPYRVAMSNPRVAAMSKLFGILAIAFACTSNAAPLNVNLQAEAVADEQLTAPRPPAEELDIRTLELRLRETRAIDPLSKLRLKGQIDELVGRFRQMHETGMSTRVGTLRQPYENVIGKLQSMLARDPLLASDIESSREPIWRVLADPGKFRSQMSAVR